MRKIYLLLFFISFVGFGQNSDKKLDSLKSILKTTKIDITKINTLNILSKEYASIDFKTALDYAKNALKISLNKNYIEGQIDAYRNIGRIENYNFNIEASLLNYQKSLSLANKINDKKRIAKLYNSIANVYMDETKYTLALDYYLKALKINELLKNKEDLYGNYVNIADVYLTYKNIKKALYYLDLSQKCLMNNRENTTDLQLYTKIHLELKDYKKAKTYADSVYNYGVKTNNPNSISVRSEEHV